MLLHAFQHYSIYILLCNYFTYHSNLPIILNNSGLSRPKSAILKNNQSHQQIENYEVKIISAYFLAPESLELKKKVAQSR
jgi:hypothetical protein